MEWSHLSLPLNNSFELMVLHNLISWLIQVAGKITASVRVVINRCEPFDESLLFLGNRLLNLVAHLFYLMIY